MCNFKNKNQSVRAEDAGCPYPAFFESLPALPLGNTLPLDTEGYCIFHSSNLAWKLEQQFTQRFNELMAIMEFLSEKRGQDLDLLYRFSGFIFPDALQPVCFDRLVGNLTIDLSHCIFEHGLTITHCKLARLKIFGARFKETVNINNTEISREPNATKAIFEHGLIMYNCTFNGYASFNRCTFSNVNDPSKFAFLISDSRFLDAMDFNDSNFRTNVSFRDVVFENEVSFDRCTFEDEFYFHQVTLGGVASFKHTEFKMSANANPIYSCISFVDIGILEKGKVDFQGRVPFDDMVKGEMQMEFVPDFLGRVSFQNFNLNKLRPQSKAKVLKLAASDKIDIGRGCLKYRHQTEIKRIVTDVSNLAIFEELARTFANYYAVYNGFSLGVEMVERTETSLEFFYFSDENITFDDFLARFGEANTRFWGTGSNGSSGELAAITRSNHLEVDSAINLFQFCLKLFVRFPSKEWTFNDLLQIAFTTSPDDTPAIAVDAIEPGVNRYLNFVIKNINVMGNVNIGNLNADNSQVILGDVHGTVNGHFGFSAEEITALVDAFRQKGPEFQKGVADEVKDIEAMESGPLQAERMEGLRVMLVEDGIPVLKNLSRERAFVILKTAIPRV